MKILVKITERTLFVEIQPQRFGYLTLGSDGCNHFTPQNQGLNFEVLPEENLNRKIENTFQGLILAPSQGRIVKVLVSSNQKVSQGDLLCVIEVMKMNIDVQSPVNMDITDVLVRVDQYVQEKNVLIKGKEVFNVKI